MNKNLDAKCIKLSGETLKVVLEISKTTHRNYTAAAEYLIAKGIAVHNLEQDQINALKNNYIFKN